LELEAKLKAMSENQENHNDLITPIVDEEDIAQIVAFWTGVPVNKLTESESEQLIHLEDTLHSGWLGKMKQSQLSPVQFVGQESG
jgi:ATP-dependent Clp protease ATP-binding subunit ClpC